MQIRPAPGPPSVDDVPDTADSDPTRRVHHHARLGGSSGAGGEYTTLCGLRITPRPEARHMPCCPMCAAEMEAMGRACRVRP